MAVRIAPNQISKGSTVVYPKTTPNLMQNCDLPPPTKLISSPDDTFISSISKSHNKKDLFLTSTDSSENYKKLEILKALRLSQTRAREAERKLAVLNKEKDEISNLVVKESLRVFAHRNWIKLLEFEVTKLQRENGGEKWSRFEDCDEVHSRKKWCIAVVCCLGITGMGFAIFSDFSSDSTRF